MARSRYKRFITIACVLLAPLGIARAEDDGVNHSNVYQRIKDADTGGLTVGRHAEGRADPDVEILLDEQGAASGGRGSDAAPRPLFRKLDESKLNSVTYSKFIALLDNYVVRQQDSESYSAEEQQEIDQFVDAVAQTPPMAIALSYIQEDLGNMLTAAEFRDAVESIWFDIYTNHHGGTTPFCSGFEHVFVGEGKYPAAGSAPRRGEIGGYHGWIQFYREEKAGRVNYLGHKYDLPPARKPANPCVITLRMIWNHDPDGSGPEAPVELFKSPKGGFFVGLSPECEIAMGTVAFFEQKAGLLTSDNKRRTVIDGATYDLTLHPSVKSNGQRGEHIRSFFPVLIGHAEPSDDPEVPAGDGPVRIAAALPNPPGEDETGEWFELRNVSEETIDLAGWEVRDRQNGTRQLQGTLDVGQTIRFQVPRAEHTLRMGNDGGTLRLFRADELIDEASYGRASSGAVIRFLEP